jgi:3-oxoacyl-[acyl-carrier-protein] synthase-1
MSPSTPAARVDLVVTGLAVVCPVGLDATLACAALRAGVSRLAEHDGYTCLPPEGVARESDGEPEPLVAGKVPTLPDDAGGPERLQLLALAALQRMVAEGELGRKDVGRTALFLVLPAADPVVAGWNLGKTFAPELCRRAGVGDWAVAQCVQAGPVGAFRAIDAARALLATGRVDRCLVLSADTYLDAERLAALDEGWRIRSQRNPDGFLPGEAASALLLEPARAAARRKARALGLVAGPSFGNEPVSAERWSTGRGLAEAIRPLLEGTAGPVGRYMLCNMNGEAYPAREWAVAQMRLAPDLPVVESLVHPADGIGEAGAAMAGILVACACHAYARGCAPVPAALLWVGSDDGGRAAAVIRPGG